ncbi:sensor histidine kinase [Methylobacter tundripaludum]|uniref:histidine kinase n=1 Tax=Methylobacter tundripaludum (strain ATCC BAA-1195 / DSM 17260 / SV96) TaxID=697282 RepID=G3IWX4_METTV|nr:ATP-binding protein [Methylobacter tundripaludum]EGW23329.1 histidine kinase [Methylobacter tundripaludum SV96]
MKPIGERYFQILQQVVFADDTYAIEVYLAEAFELGRALVDQKVPPDEVTHIHHEAVVRFSRTHPSLSFAQVADRLTRPLMEMTMAYGLAFREQMERQYQDMVNSRLAQSHKLEAVGTLAAGIAHDFNNLLGSIIGFAEMAGDELPEGSSGKHSINHVLTASFRARDLVTRMLTFARQSPVKSVAVEVEVVAQMQETLELLSVSYKKGLEIRFQTGIERVTVMADPGQLQQIVMNLCINAADAMSHRGVVAVGLDFARFDDCAKAGICLKVIDSGHGMPPEVQERIFDPFFTTKAPNKGSGLGLSVVYGIVTQLGGLIEVQSRAAGGNSGTEFKVFLPLANNPPDGENG